MRRLGRLSIRARLTVWYSAILLSILLIVSGLGYSLLRRSLVLDLDASLVIVAQLIRDAGYAEADAATHPEATLHEILGTEFYDKFFQLVDPEGRPSARSAQLRGRELPMSARARTRAARGERTIETVELTGNQSVRLLTMPVMRADRPSQLIQVGMSFDRVERALARYLETLLILIPLGVGLAAAGGIVLARSALRPVDAMSRAARRITAEDLAQRITPRGADDELDHLAGTLNAMLARLEDAFAQVRRFAADAAHELRTPLTALKAGIEVALRAGRSPEEYRAVLRSSLEEVERLIRLAEDLLLLSRLSAGTPLLCGPLDLEPLVVEVFDIGVRLAEGTGVTVRLGEMTPATVIGDGTTLRRALVNLVENAVKYTPAGGKVELSLEHVDGRVAIAVTDTGVGLDHGDSGRIFEPFVRLDVARARDTGGAGLGLAIARSIVLSQGGAITVRSSPGAGSTFTVCLSLA